MAFFLLRRLAASLLLVLLVLSATFLFAELVPGDPAAALLDPRVSPDHREAVRRSFGLDRPLPERYLAWLGASLRLDLGISFDQRRPVRDVLADYLPKTLLLSGAALIVQFWLGLWLGARAARRAGSLSDHAIRVVSLLLYALPSFWLGLMALLVFSHWLGLFPPGHFQSVGAGELSLAGRAADVAHHLALPALVLGLATAGGVARQSRASLIEALGQDYVRTARAKGLAPGKVLWVHALRNALAPLIQLLGLSLPFLIGGSLVIEIVFAWPGMGWMTRDAVAARDYPLILAATAASAVMVVAGSLVADLLQAWLDPRVRLDGKI